MIKQVMTRSPALLALAVTACGSGASAPRTTTAPVAEEHRPGDTGVVYGAPRAPVEKHEIVAPPPLVGLALVGTIAPDHGFVDDPFRFDGGGGRLVWVNSDADRYAELRIADLGQSLAQVTAVDLSAVTAAPLRLDFTDDGNYFVVEAASAEGQVAAIIVSAGADDTAKVLRRFGPATDIRLTNHDGKQVVVVFDTAAAAKPAGATDYSVALFAADTGKAIGKKQSFRADKDGKIAAIDLRINHFADDYLRIVGTAGGTWDAKEDQRSPDEEGWYDVVGRTYSKRRPIADVIANATILAVLAHHWNQPRFVELASDLSTVNLVENDTITPVVLDEPLHHYQRDSLEWELDPGGTLFFTLRISPTNPDAVGRQDLDPEYLDLYELAPGSARATRRARLLVEKRAYRWHATREHWALLERHIGFSRGGKRVDVYRLE